MRRESIKAALRTLIANSNTKTGASDTTITAAMSRLISRYNSGSGGGSTAQIETDDVTGSGNEYLSFNCSFEPDAVIIYASNQTSENLTASALAYAAVYNRFGMGYRYNGSAFYVGYAADISSELPWGETNGNTQVKGSYSNGVFTVRYRGANAQYWWNSAYTYHCIGIKF